MEVQWLRLYAPSAGGVSSVPDQGAKIPQAEWQKKKSCFSLINVWQSNLVKENLSLRIADEEQLNIILKPNQIFFKIVIEISW